MTTPVTTIARQQPSTFDEQVPADVIQEVANGWLTPRERARLALCNKRLNSVLPPALRIRISSAKGDGGLAHDFFVTPVDDDDNDNGGRHKVGSNSHRFLLDNEHMYYGRRYHLWSFDYVRNNKVYLGRHTRHGMMSPSSSTTAGVERHDQSSSSSPSHYLSIGLRPKRPNQTWEVMGGDDGDVVIWGDDVSLAVSGPNPRLGQPDSMQRSMLSYVPSSLPPQQSNWRYTATTMRNHSGTPAWCAVSTQNHRRRSQGDDHDKTGRSAAERLHLLPSRQWSLADAAAVDDVSETDRTVTRRQDTKLAVHAVPDACDEGEYLMYSPDSLKDGEISCDGMHVVVKFEFWIHKGMMYFRCPVLPFTLGIPILETDDDDDNHHEDEMIRQLTSDRTSDIHPVSKLLDLRSARWGCLIYYVAVAADVSEEKPLDMNRFLERVTDHKEHAVEVTGRRKDLVCIQVQGKTAVKTSAPDVPRSGGWSFLLSW